mmetsp:Transcript_72969/g.115948  ORF Transcript_72969/g.115948 Transcript_72969/m.115948 type:complete len:88 (+) Transcript_72969:75-338(+)
MAVFKFDEADPFASSMLQSDKRGPCSKQRSIMSFMSFGFVSLSFFSANLKRKRQGDAREMMSLQHQHPSSLKNCTPRGQVIYSLKAW